MKYPVIPSLLLAVSLAPLTAADVPLALIGLTPDTGSSPYDGVTNAAAGTIRGLALPGLAVTVKVDANVVGVVVAGPDGGWALPLTIPLADGSHTISVAAPGIGTRTATQAIRIDTAVPKVATWTSLVPDSGRSATDWVTAAGDVVINAKAEAGAQLALTLDGVALPGLTVPANGIWQVPFTALPDGDHVLAASVSDLAGNVSPLVTRSLRIDHVAPTAPVIATVSSDTGKRSDDRLTRDDTPTFSGASEPDAQISILCDGVPSVGVRASAAGAWRVTTPQIAAGDHVFTAIATDAAGNVSEPSAGFALVIKTATIAPAVAITTDTGAVGDFITGDKTLVFSGDAAPGDQVALTIDAKVVARVDADATGRWSIDRTRYPLADGVHPVVVSATDAAGNVATAPQLNLVVDTVAPTISQLAIVGRDPATGLIVSGESLHISGLVEPGCSVELTLDGAPLATVQGSPTATGWSFDSVAPAAGQYLVAARAVDAAGNVSATVQQPIVVSVPPVVQPPQPVMVNFRAVVTEVSNDAGMLQGLPIGTVILGTYSYHLGQADGDPRGDVGTYYFAGATEGYRLDMGMYHFVSNGDLTMLLSNATFAGESDSMSIYSKSISELGGLACSKIDWELTGPMGLGLASDALTAAAPDLQMINGPLTITGPFSPATGAPMWRVTASVQTAWTGSTTPPTDPNPPTDTTPPPPPVIMPVGGPTQLIYAGLPVQVSGTTEPGATVHVTVDGVDIGQGTAATGSWSLITAFALGTHQLSAFAVDLAGNVGPAAPVQPIVVVAAPATGPSVTIRYQAVVDQIDDQSGMVPGILPGVAVSGGYTYRTGMADSNPLAQVADYQFTESGMGISLDVAGYFFRSDPVQTNFLLELIDNYNQSDNYLWHSYQNVELSGRAPVGIISMQLNDATQLALSSTQLTADAPMLPIWIGGSNLWFGGDGGRTAQDPTRRWQAHARITNLWVEVPPTEPPPPADTTPPPAPIGLAVVVESDPTRSEIRVGDRLTVSGDAEPGATVNLLVDGLPVGSFYTRAVGSWSYPGLLLGLGAHSISATATDAAGNTGPESARLTVNVVPVVAPPVLAPVTIGFTAVVDSVDDTALVTGVQVGQTLTGTYTYRPGGQSSNASPNVGDYRFTEAGMGMRIATPGGLTFASSPTAPDFLIELINDDPTGDHLVMASYRNVELTGRTPVSSIFWQLDDTSRRALGSIGLTADPPRLTDWQSMFGLDIAGGDDTDPVHRIRWDIRAHVTTVWVEPAPNPNNG